MTMSTAVPPAKFRAVIIGTGNIARQHARGLQAHAALVDLVAVQDINLSVAKTFATAHGVPAVYATTAELLAGAKPDLVHICTPPSFHTALAIQCMEAGAHVLCEKPLCASLAELDLIQMAEKRTGRFCASVFQMRYGSSVQHVRDVLAAGEVGRPLVAVCNTLWFRSPAYYEVPWRGKWTNELGGPTVGHGIHLMDQMLYVLGEWSSLRAVARTADRAIEVEDLSVAMVEFKSGCVATVINSILSPREETYLRIDLQQATVELTHLYGFNNQSWRFTPRPGAAADAQAKLVATPAPGTAAPSISSGPGFDRLCALPADRPANHEAHIGGVLADLRLGTVPLTAGPEARNTIELLTAIYKSSFTGQAVARGSIVPGDPFYEAFHGGRSSIAPSH